MPHPGGHPGNIDPTKFLPQLIAWEVTRSCLLNCKHCRASATSEVRAGEFSTDECYRLLDNIASFSKPIIILTGGEPMLRADIYDIARYACKLGLPVVMAPCGLLVNNDTARQIADSGVRRISLSLDGATAATHDAFRGFAGAYQSVMDAIEASRAAGLDFQINSTISRHNFHEMNELLDLAVRVGASVFNPFLLVPTGRGRELIDQELSPQQYEEALHWLAAQQRRKDIQLRVTCAPHYQRILRQAGCGDLAGHGRGCMGGKGFAFVSHTGKVQICGFLDIECGDVRASGYDFRSIWESSPVFLQMRDVDHYHGRCGACEFRKVCGGCRARAYAVSGDYLGEEPFCTYKPKRGEGGGAGVSPASSMAVSAMSSTPVSGVSNTGVPPVRTEEPNESTAHGRDARETHGRDGHATHGQDAHATAPDALDDLDKKVLSAIQADFPIERRPFEVLGRRLGLGSREVLETVQHLAATGIIRRLGAVFDSRRLGFASTLVAAKVPPERLEEVAACVSAISGVTHNYRREHAYNLWFTLTCHDQAELDRTLDDLRARFGNAELHSLPALRVYKSRVVFSLDENAPAEEVAAVPSDATPVSLDARQRAIVQCLQGSIPLVEEPFEALARETRLTADELRSQVAAWLDLGVVKRFGAVVGHRKLGFVANGMAVFAVGSARQDEVGRRLSAERSVSHCYIRPTLPDWPYNLFAMVHGRAEAEVRDRVNLLAKELGLSNYDLLFSTAEYKKSSMDFLPAR